MKDSFSLVFKRERSIILIWGRSLYSPLFYSVSFSHSFSSLISLRDLFTILLIFIFPASICAPGDSLFLFYLLLILELIVLLWVFIDLYFLIWVSVFSPWCFVFGSDLTTLFFFIWIAFPMFIPGFLLMHGFNRLVGCVFFVLDLGVLVFNLNCG